MNKGNDLANGVENLKAVIATLDHGFDEKVTALRQAIGSGVAILRSNPSPSNLEDVAMSLEQIHGTLDDDLNAVMSQLASVRESMPDPETLKDDSTEKSEYADTLLKRLDAIRSSTAPDGAFYTPSQFDPNQTFLPPTRDFNQNQPLDQPGSNSSDVNPINSGGAQVVAGDGDGAIPYQGPATPSSQALGTKTGEIPASSDAALTEGNNQNQLAAANAANTANPIDAVLSSSSTEDGVTAKDAPEESGDKPSAAPRGPRAA